MCLKWYLYEFLLNRQLPFSLRIDFLREGASSQGSISFEHFLERIPLYFIKLCVDSQTSNNLKVATEEVPPIMSPSLRGPVILNTEMEKKSVLLKNSKNPEGNSFGYSFYLSLFLQVTCGHHVGVIAKH